jgi:hypothetical protein
MAQNGIRVCHTLRPGRHALHSEPETRCDPPQSTKSLRRRLRGSRGIAWERRTLPPNHKTRVWFSECQEGGRAKFPFDLFRLLVGQVRREVGPEGPDCIGLDGGGAHAQYRDTLLTSVDGELGNLSFAAGVLFNSGPFRQGLSSRP